MKIITLFTICLISLYSFSQEYKKNLYIFINEKPIIKINNDTLSIERYLLKMNTNINASKIKLKIDKSGNLIKEISINNSPRILNFKYENINCKNEPRIIKKSDVKNYLLLNEINYDLTFENFIEIFNYFNIYIINQELISDEYYIVKRVEFEKYVGL